MLDAYLTLTEAGGAEPTMEQLAELAGVSHRSVFRYFDDRAALVVAVAERVGERLAPVVAADPSPAAPLEIRIAGFVDRRVRAYDLLGRTAARVTARCEDLSPGSLAAARQLTRDDVEQHFAPELARYDSDRRSEVVTLAAMPFQHLAIHELAIDCADRRQSLSKLLRAHLTQLLD